MPWFRIFFVAVICAFCAGVDVSAQSVRVQQDSGAKTILDVTPTATTPNEKICKNVGEDCRGYGAKTASKCDANKKCPITDCDNERGFYYVVYQENPNSNQYRKMGWCANEANCNSVPECKNKNCRLVTTTLADGMKVAIQQPTGQRASSRKFLCEFFDDICTPDVLDTAHADKGEPIIKTQHEDDYCKPTLCIDGYILPNDPITKENASCQPCRKCEPGTGADCKPNGSNGLHECRYQTSCLPGYDNIKHNGEYNPECLPNEYNIRYELNGVDGNCTPTSYTFDSSENTTIGCQPTKEGYNFAGWCRDAGLNDCKGPDPFKLEDNEINDITFYAKWIKQDCEQQYTNTAETACVCSWGGKWVNDTCECDNGTQWNSDTKTCDPIPECDGKTKDHTTAYTAAIDQILDSFNNKAKALCTATEGWTLNGTICKPTKESEEQKQVQEQKDKQE